MVDSGLEFLRVVDWLAEAYTLFQRLLDLLFAINVRYGSAADVFSTRLHPHPRYFR